LIVKGNSIELTYTVPSLHEPFKNLGRIVVE